MSTVPGPVVDAMSVASRSSEHRGWQEVISDQRGVISVRDALAGGMTRSEIRWRLTSGRWQRPMKGVVVAHSGSLTEEQRRWCAVESIGPVCFLAGPAAAAVAGLVGFPSDSVHVLVPAARNPVPRPGVRVHRSTFLGYADVHSQSLPPRTRLERSVIDMASWARTDARAETVIAAAVQQRLTTVALLRAALERTGQRPRRGMIAATLDDIEGGAHSSAELAYRRIERRFGLPTGTRQASADLDGRRCYLDVWYEPWRVWVEVDGGHHMASGQWQADLERQNLGVLGDRLVLRFTSRMIREDPDKVAKQVGDALRLRGWAGPRQ